MRKIITLFVLFICWGSVLSAGEILLSNTQTPGVQMISETGRGDTLNLHITCDLDKIFSHDVDTVKGKFSIVYLPKFHFGGEYGTPQLPVFNRLIQIPSGANYHIEVTGFEKKVYKLSEFGINHRIYPRQPSAPKNHEKVPFFYEPSAYFKKGFGGKELATLEEIGTLRHMRLSRLVVAPIRYDPIRNWIAVYNNMKLKITFSSVNLSESRAKHQKYWSPAFQWMENQVMVPQALRFAERNTPEGYLIIADPAFRDSLTPFIAWKTQKGFKVKVVYTDKFGTADTTLAEDLKNYIHTLYKDPTEDMPAPSYLLFVGDNEQIPAYKGTTGSHITDLPYFAITPGDFLPDILAGRFSAQTLAHLKPQIDKTLEYEKYLFPDPSFLKDVVLVAGWDGSWARSHGWPHINYAKKYYLNKKYGFKKVNFYLSAGSQQNVSSIIADVGRGAAYVNYTAHGDRTSWSDPKFRISNIDSLGNKGKYPFVIGNCCLTSSFQIPTCFGEGWLRAKNAGAIGYVGGSNYTYWDEDFWWGVGLHSIVKPNNEGTPPEREDTGPGVFEAMFQGAGVTNAGFMVAGNLAVEESSSTRKNYYWEVYHLMGDPSLTTYMGKPRALKATYLEQISREATSIKVLAPAGSYIGISDGEGLLGAGYVTTKQGSVIIPLKSLTRAGEAIVVVTAPNRIPFIGKLTIR
ncbi:C25 family cysteine peptidase [Candidatus Riflebacteria bacterium]